MFGHQDHEDPTNTNNQNAPTAPADPQADATLSGASTPAPITTSAPAIDEDIASDYIATPHSAPTAATPSPDPIGASNTPTDELTTDDMATPAAPDTNGLLDLKQDALQKLSPLLGHLD